MSQEELTFCPRERETCFLKELYPTVRAQPEDKAVTRVCECWWGRCPVGTDVENRRLEKPAKTYLGKES